MAARKKDNSDAVSLFPFMSILVALIGSLTLMIAVLSAGQMNQEQSQDVIDRYKDYSEIKAQVERDRAQLEKLKQLLGDTDQLHEQIRLAADEAAALEKKHKDFRDRVAASGHDKLLAEANRLRQRITDLEPDPAKLQKTIKELEAEVKKRKAGPEEAIVQIRPGGSGVDVVPTFVECTSTGVVIHEGKEPLRIRAGDLNKEDGDFHKLLDRVAGTPKGQVILLVRPDAVGTYNTARYVAQTHFGPNGYCRTGKLPVPSQGNIDLSIFRR